jgi:hypothetical protein
MWCKYLLIQFAIKKSIEWENLLKAKHKQAKKSIDEGRTCGTMRI